MYRTINFRLPARRSAAALGAAAALAAGAGLALAPAAQAAPAHSGTTGTATATVLRAGLDVSLLNKTVDVPVDVSLNDVKAPAEAKETALTVTVGHGVEAGRPVDILRASAATANATADRHKAEGYANVAAARVHVPGLPLLSLVAVDAVTSKATCEAGHHPTASSHLAGVTVLGRRIALNAVGTTHVAVPGVGQVDLDLTSTTTTSDFAAATALQLKVHVNPLNLGVADVSGSVTLAQATCHTPKGGTGGSGGTSGGGANGGSTNGGSTSGSGGTNGGSTSGSSGGSTSGGSAGSTSGASNGGTSGGGSSSGSGGTGSSGSTGASGSSGSGGNAQTVADSSHTGDLAETGASSATPYLAAGAAALVAAGALVFVVTGRRRKAARGAGEADV
ncbi:SCO1860 family LAETG-anchored protein [Actinacidiphila guanduensis]|uniref:LPXTG-motif cell wall anchor domain-containing protein n=1 Tax=Actinacidiphila guanduensis TaxID=310781 RepID=A0A1H0E3N2_9ACTN|nr:SCO1860 family LAETG-anchored protein [Actinacidiphila guanduensis]SDN77087.1 LPXTG-motif cell wall anchor domain-containing protein [Actinacidiphila guanduensis]